MIHLKQFILVTEKSKAGTIMQVNAVFAGRNSSKVLEHSGFSYDFTSFTNTVSRSLCKLKLLHSKSREKQFLAKYSSNKNRKTNETDKRVIII